MKLLCGNADFFTINGITNLETPIVVSSNDAPFFPTFLNVKMDPDTEGRLLIEYCKMYPIDNNNISIQRAGYNYFDESDPAIVSGKVYDIIRPKSVITEVNNLTTFVQKTETTHMKQEFMASCFGSGTSLALYRNSETSEVFIKFKSTTFFSGVDFTVYDKALEQHALDNDPNYNYEGTVSKINLLNVLDANDSFSYTDIQLDMITHILFDMIDSDEVLKNKVLQRFPNFEDFKSSLEKNSIFNLRNNEQCYNKMNEVKTQVRSIQKIWYENKKKLSVQNLQQLNLE